MCECASLLTEHLKLHYFFFFNDTATTEIYTLSLHDALPISLRRWPSPDTCSVSAAPTVWAERDRKSTRLNSSHSQTSYAVFCVKKKRTTSQVIHTRWALNAGLRASSHPSPP